MKNYRILMVSGSGKPLFYGVSDYTGNLLQTFRQMRPEWDYTWLCRRSRWFHSPVISGRGLRIVRPTHNWNYWGTELVNKTVAWMKPDLIHIQDQIHSYFETDAAVRIAKAAKCPIVVTLHEFHNELASVKHTIELVKIANVVIANDFRTSKRCQEFTGRIPDYQAWSPANLFPPESSQIPPTISGRITTFGLISETKYPQLPIVFEALNLLRQQGLDLSWRIIGPFEPQNNPYHAKLQQQFNVPWVEFTGAFPDLNDSQLLNLLAESQVMILPFADGASPRRGSLQAAWSFGLPVVTTQSTIDEPDIQNGVNCLLVNQFTPQAWGTAIKSLLLDDQLRKQISLGSLSTAKIFNWESLAKLHFTIFDRLLAQP